jgi:hypothetical protein
MQRLRAEYPDYLGLYVTDDSGAIVCSTDEASIGIVISDRFHVREALRSDRFTVGEYVVGRADGRPALPFGLPYRDMEGKIAGVVAAAVKLSWLERYYAERSFPRNSALLIAGRNGVVLARAPTIPGLVGTMLPPHLLALARAERSGTAEILGLDGVPRIGAYIPFSVGSDGTFIAVTLDRAAALAPVHAATVRALGVIAAVLVLVLVAI